MNLRSSACICGFILLAASAAQAQDGMVLGKLRLANGQSIEERVRVELQTYNGLTAGVQYTDSNGNFNFMNLAYGKYDVVVVSDRCSAPPESVQLHGDMPTVRVFIYASVREGAPPAVPNVPTADPFSVTVKELMQTYPRGAVKQYEAGLKKTRSGDAEGAIAAYQKALQAAPDFYLAHNNLGVLYMNAGQAERAAEHFQQAIRLNDKPGQPYTNLGRIYFESGDLDRAREMLDKAVEKGPASAVAAFLAGSVCFRQGQSARAETLLRRAHQLDPTMSRVHLQLANLFMRESRRQETIKELEAFLREHPNDPQAAAVRQRLAGMK